MSRFFGAKLAVARAAGSLSRRTGRGGGTTLPGRLLLRLSPNAITELGSRLGRGSTVISATNGKTTTAGMLAAAMQAAGRPPVHNRAGSNMTWGVATALLSEQGDEGLFEVDEFWLGQVVDELEPRALLLANLFRDQLDRYGELERLADDWAQVVQTRAGRSAFVLNADDPLIADLGRDADLNRRPDVTYVGVEDTSQALPELQHARDAKHCRRCGAPYSYSAAFVGHLGHYTCPNCGADRPAPDVAAESVRLHGMKGSTVGVRTPAGTTQLKLPLPGLYNVYNALGALAAALELGIGLETAVGALESVESAFGRVETIDVAGKPVSILLITNPAGANEVLRTVKLEAGSDALDVWVALNDRIADGRDVSCVWDADFELIAGSVRRVHCAGTRAAEMAVRLKYAGVPADRIAVEEQIDRSLDAAVADAGGALFALPTYTALIELRRLLTRRGLAREYWA